MNFKFYKSSTNRWYVDLPNWPGPKDDLEMSMGADIMLDIIAQGEGEVLLDFTLEPNEKYDTLVFLKETEEFGEGAYYHMESYQGFEFNLDVWLCDVTKFVFGDFPKVIYFSII